MTATEASYREGMERGDAARPGDAVSPEYRALVEDVAFVLGDGVPRTPTEIAKAVRRRRIAVEEVLKADRRFVRVAAPRGRSRKAQTWVLAAEARGQVGTSVCSVCGGGP